MAANLHISIAAEPITHLGGLAITNSIFTSLLISAMLIILSLIVKANLKETARPTGLQNVFEWIIESLESLVASVTQNKAKTKLFFPFIATFFLWILFNNWLGLVPGVGTIGFLETPTGEVHAQLQPAQINIPSQQVQAAEINVEAAVLEAANTHAAEKTTELAADSHQTEATEKSSEHSKFVPYFRPGTADLNTTLALGIFSIVLTQFFGLKYQGLKYLKKFFNFSNPIMTFVGLLELVSEFAKIISFAFRLFGNIFAGEVLLAVISFLAALVVPMPFYGLEIFVGFIQALVFAMLSLVFFNMATHSH